jgi:hypothetical protein
MRTTPVLGVVLICALFEATSAYVAAWPARVWVSRAVKVSDGMSPSG